MAASPPTVEPAAPVADMAPPVSPPAAVAEPDDASAPSTPSVESVSTVELASWSVPLAVAGGLLAGVALAVPMVRRQKHAIGPARADGRVLPRLDDALRTHPGASREPGESATLLTGPVPPVRESVITAPNARLNGSPVPYLGPIQFQADHRPGYSTNVAGLPWSDLSADDRSDRALA